MDWRPGKILGSETAVAAGRRAAAASVVETGPRGKGRDDRWVGVGTLAYMRARTGPGGGCGQVDRRRTCSDSGHSLASCEVGPVLGNAQWRPGAGRSWALAPAWERLRAVERMERWVAVARRACIRRRRRDRRMRPRWQRRWAALPGRVGQRCAGGVEEEAEEARVRKKTPGRASGGKPRAVEQVGPGVVRLSVGLVGTVLGVLLLGGGGLWPQRQSAEERENIRREAELREAVTAGRGRGPRNGSGSCAMEEAGWSEGIALSRREKGPRGNCAQVWPGRKSKPRPVDGRRHLALKTRPWSRASSIMRRRIGVRAWCFTT